MIGTRNLQVYLNNSLDTATFLFMPMIAAELHRKMLPRKYMSRSRNILHHYTKSGWSGYVHPERWMMTLAA